VIIKASQRGFARNLANHLASTNDNDHVSLMEIRGVMGQSLHAALVEMEAISQGTRCRQPFFSVSFNPPPDKDVSHKAFEDAFDTVEQTLGLQGQPRVVVYHEKSARRHAHVIWLRVRIDDMKAIRMSHFKRKCAEVSRLLYLRHGWDMPAGFKDFRLKDPFHLTTAEWQQNLRNNIDPKDIKAMCQGAWKQSDGALEFQQALQQKGLFIARGDRRGFVVIDAGFKVYSLSRYSGIARKDIKERLGSPELLPSVEVIKKTIRSIYNRSARSSIAELELRHVSEISRHALVKKELIDLQREEREIWRQDNQGGVLRKAFRRVAVAAQSLSRKFTQVSGMRSKSVDADSIKEKRQNVASFETWEGMIFRHNHESRKLLVHTKKIREKQRDERTALASQILATRRDEPETVVQSAQPDFEKRSDRNTQPDASLKDYRIKRTVSRKGGKSAKPNRRRGARLLKGRSASRNEAQILKRKRHNPRFLQFLRRRTPKLEYKEVFNNVTGAPEAAPEQKTPKKLIVPRMD